MGPALQGPAPGRQPGAGVAPAADTSARGLPANGRLRRLVGPRDRGEVAGASPLTSLAHAEAGHVTAGRPAPQPAAPARGPRRGTLCILTWCIRAGLWRTTRRCGRGAWLGGRRTQSLAGPRSRCPRPAPPRPAPRASQRLHHPSYIKTAAFGAFLHWECDGVSVRRGTPLLPRIWRVPPSSPSLRRLERGAGGGRADRAAGRAEGLHSHLWVEAGRQHVLGV